MPRTHDGTIDVRLRHSSVKAFPVGSKGRAYPQVLAAVVVPDRQFHVIG